VSCLKAVCRPCTSHGTVMCLICRFRGLLSDLFPGSPVTDATNAELEARLHEAAVAKKMDLTKQQVLATSAERHCKALAGVCFCTCH
jgi:hypothetical protein